LREYSMKFGLNGSLIESLFALIMEEVVTNHRKLR
jgi:chorismate mutase